MMCCRQRCFSTAAAAVLALQSFATVCTLRFLLKRWQPSRQGNDWQARLAQGDSHSSVTQGNVAHFLPGVEVWWSAVWLATSVPHIISATPDTLQHPGPLLSSPCQSPFAPSPPPPPPPGLQSPFTTSTRVSLLRTPPTQAQASAHLQPRPGQHPAPRAAALLQCRPPH